MNGFNTYELKETTREILRTIILTENFKNKYIINSADQKSDKIYITDNVVKSTQPVYDF